jgi:ECF sigma factor
VFASHRSLLVESAPLVVHQPIEQSSGHGLRHEETAAALGITDHLVRQKWTYARAWLSDALNG